MDIGITSVQNQISMELEKGDDVTILLELFGTPTKELQKESIGTITMTITK